MEEFRNLGRILLSNLFLNSKGLNKFIEESKDEETNESNFNLNSKMFGARRNFVGYRGDDPRTYPDEVLYPLLLITTKPEKIVNVGKSKNYVKNQRIFIDKVYSSGRPLFESRGLRLMCQEAHNRTCEKFGVEPTEIMYSNFFKCYYTEDTPGVFNFAMGKIILNAEINYFEKNPTALLEIVNMLSRDHINFKNSLEVLKNPDKLSTYDYFVVMTDAVSYYVSEQMKLDENLAKKFPEYSKWVGFFPSIIDREKFAYQETREKMQSAKVYGGEVRNALRAKEIFFHNELQNKVAFNSMVAVENLVVAFQNSKLNASSNGLMGNILRRVVDETAPYFYNQLGADMNEGETIAEYLDCIEEYKDKYPEKNLAFFENVLPREGFIFYDANSQGSNIESENRGLTEVDETLPQNNDTNLEA